MMDWAGIAKMSMPAQLGVAARGGTKGLASLIGCTGAQEITQGNQEQVIYPKGSHVCYVVGSSTMTVKLLEDLTTESMNVKAEMPNGLINFIPAQWVVDASRCQ